MTHKEMIKFGKNYVKKCNFNSEKEPASINDVNIINILVSNKYNAGKKNFKYFWLYKSF